MIIYRFLLHFIDEVTDRLEGLHFHYEASTLCKRLSQTGMGPNEELPTWKKLIRSMDYHEEVNSWPDDDPRLLAVYYIAEQDYCEWKATYEKEEGRVPDSELDQRSRKEGREGHRALVKAESDDGKTVREGLSGPGPTPLGESIDAGDEIITDSQTLVAPLDEFAGPSGAEVDSFYLIGEADNIVFGDGVPKAVVERKFVRDRREVSNSNLEITYTNERIQGWLYARLLDNLGFDTSDLQVILLKHHKGLRKDTDHQIEALDRAVEGSEGARVPTKYGPDGTTVMGPNAETVSFAEPYRRGAHEEFLTDALSYWRGDREAKGPGTAGKCRGCGFQEDCPHSLV